MYLANVSSLLRTDVISPFPDTEFLRYHCDAIILMQIKKQFFIKTVIMTLSSGSTLLNTEHKTVCSPCMQPGLEFMEGGLEPTTKICLRVTDGVWGRNFSEKICHFNAVWMTFRTFAGRLEYLTAKLWTLFDRVTQPL